MARVSQFGGGGSLDALDYIRGDVPRKPAHGLERQEHSNTAAVKSR